jgi:hypothetical protein
LFLPPGSDTTTNKGLFGTGTSDGLLLPNQEGAELWIKTFLLLPSIRTSSNSIYIATDGKSASSSWCLAPFGMGEQMLHLF